MKIIAEKTYGKSFKSHKFCHDTKDYGGISYDSEPEVKWKSYGETERFKTPINLENEMIIRSRIPSIFSFFLDGSRKTYKVDDVSYKKSVYPILAGQIGVGCCERKDKKLFPALPFERKLVISLPNKAFSNDQWIEEDLAKSLLIKINNEVYKKNKIKFDKILIYSTSKDEEYEKKGIATIQDYMVEQEKKIVAELVTQGKVNEDNYLIKDGSLDYQRISHKKNKDALNLSDDHIAQYYKYVIGVSKSFNPTKCFVEGGGVNSDVIANLKLYHRTPAFRYSSSRAGVDFGIWYVRIRDSKYTSNIFDGILKVEKILITDKEKEDGIETEEINNITAHLLNERNPVCYGNDLRWANHIYPIYLTEKYIKSKYMSNDLFMQIF